MKRRSQRLRDDLRLDLTPMVDVVFLLIIFFMVSTTFLSFESGLPVDLPNAQSSQQRPADLPTVTINAEREIYLAGELIIGGDLSSLQQGLSALLEQTPSEVVVFRADKTVPHGMTVQVIDAIKLAGAQRVAIATGN